MLVGILVWVLVVLVGLRDLARPGLDARRRPLESHPPLPSMGGGR